jgi:serine/threonine protein kinase
MEQDEAQAAPDDDARTPSPRSGRSSSIPSALRAVGQGAEGSRLGSHYEVQAVIGRGKFSTVHRAVRVADGAVVALKQIGLSAGGGGEALDPRIVDACLQEIGLVQSLSHPHIIRYMDAFVEASVLNLAFEYAEAGDLKRQIRKAREREARFDERVVWKYFSQIAEAVAYMHSRRVMHRDLKPANVLLTRGGVVKVGDLGLGRVLEGGTAHSRVGTPLYMSPEVLRGEGYAWASDVWALGCTLYELTMLVSPFKVAGLNLTGLFEKIGSGTYPPVSPVYSARLRDLVAAMLALDPSERPTAEEVATIAVDMRESGRPDGVRTPAAATPPAAIRAAVPTPPSPPMGGGGAPSPSPPPSDARASPVMSGGRRVGREGGGSASRAVITRGWPVHAASILALTQALDEREGGGEKGALGLAPYARALGDAVAACVAADEEGRAGGAVAAVAAALTVLREVTAPLAVAELPATSAALVASLRRELHLLGVAVGVARV